MIYRRKFSLDLSAQMGLLQTRHKQQRTFSSAALTGLEYIGPWEDNLKGRFSLGLNYDLGPKWRIRLAKDILHYDKWININFKLDDKFNFEGYHTFTFLYLLDPVFFGLEYRF